MTGTPRSEGYHQPAEWAPHRACWTAWPCHADLWLDKLEPARAAVASMIRAIADVDPVTGEARGEIPRVLVLDAPGEASAREALEGVPARFVRIPFGDIWLRDTAPIFVSQAEGTVAAVRFAFNGWGEKYVLEHDDQVSARVAEASLRRQFSFPWVLEGGSVEPDGEGTILTTAQCLLNPNRNPTMDREAIERGLAQSLGAEKVLWVTEGLLNDHTDGHIDTLARFVRPGVVTCMAPRRDDDPNAGVLARVADELRAMTDARGRRLEVIPIPSPGRVVDDDGRVMPASHVNFYIANTTVVVPLYGTEWDDEVVAAVAEMFPDRRAVGVDARAVLAGGGAFHCITQQEPR
ncbi:MAG: agmatine deiminase family protein [Polyangiales bacterium]